MIIACLTVILFSLEAQTPCPWPFAREGGPPVQSLEGIGNFYLPNTFTGECERVILDSTTYTLLAFSATWCIPCIRAIPMLKEIHEATKGRMNLVYIVVMDNFELWNTVVMEARNIEWRSLGLIDQNLIFRWQAGAVPSYVLVAPNGSTRRIRLHNQEDVQELFSIIGVTPIRVSTPADISWEELGRLGREHTRRVREARAR